MSLSFSRGKIQNYLGILFDYSTHGKLIITMYDYIDSVIRNAGAIYKEGAGSATPAPDNLYEIRNIPRITSYYPRKKRKNIKPSQYNACVFQRGVD